MAPAAVPPPRTPILLARHAALALRAGRPVTLRAPGREGGCSRPGRPPRPPGPGRPAPRSSSPTGASPARPRPGWRPGGCRSGPASRPGWPPPSPIRPRTGVRGRWRDDLAPADALEAGAAELCRLAGLPPLAVCLPPSAGTPGLVVPLEAVRLCRELEGLGLQPVSEAGVPLADAGDARLVAFRPADGGPDRLAILVGEPEAAAEPLCRLHSRPFAGDLLSSLGRGRDDRLRGAIRRMAGRGRACCSAWCGRAAASGPAPARTRTGSGLRRRCCATSGSAGCGC